MVQLFVGIEESKGKSFITVPMSKCTTAEEAIKIANKLYFKEKVDKLECAKGYVSKNVLKVGSWIDKEHLNVWVVARK